VLVMAGGRGTRVGVLALGLIGIVILAAMPCR
jgi:GTP:adenosylcobinamide-phosphate guanylyltransferase